MGPMVIAGIVIVVMLIGGGGILLAATAYYRMRCERDKYRQEAEALRPTEATLKDALADLDGARFQYRTYREILRSLYNGTPYATELNDLLRRIKLESQKGPKERNTDWIADLISNFMISSAPLDFGSILRDEHIPPPE